MSTWRQYAKEECSRKCEDKKLELERLYGRIKIINSDIKRLEKQISCVHEMEHHTSAGKFGGLDIDKCTKCGYECVY